jgi:hypothetical protein
VSTSTLHYSAIRQDEITLESRNVSCKITLTRLCEEYGCDIQGHLCCALQDQQTALGKLGLELHQRYPFVVPSSFVWGFGRPLWDPTARVLGLKPLRVMVLGPAASGKSIQCSMLAERCARGAGPLLLCCKS